MANTFDALEKDSHAETMFGRPIRPRVDTPFKKKVITNNPKNAEENFKKTDKEN